MRFFAALVAGALLALAFAPFSASLLAIAMPAVLLRLLQGMTPAAAAKVGFGFGLGTFSAGTYWLYISIAGFGQAPPWLAISLMAALVALMGTYSAIFGYVAARWLPSAGAARWLLALPALWVLLEWLRGWLFSGFGWLSLGYAQIDTPLAGFAPLGGMHLVSLVTMLIAGGISWWMETRGRARLAALAVVLLPWLLGALLLRIEWTRESDGPVDVTIVQGAISQDQKWLQDNRELTLQRYRELTEEALGSSLIVWPEAAIPDLANNVVPYLQELARAAEQSNSALLMGLIRAEPAVVGQSGESAEAGGPGKLLYYNSILALADEVSWYDKHHLVPFGEFFPVPAFVREWLRLLSLPYADFTRGAAVQPPLQIAGLSLSASICYEDAYPTSLHPSVRESTALVNVTNDAWFGESSARYQHLQISRMRALEAQRYLIRAANDGVSAVIGPRGEIVAAAPEYEPALLRADVVPRTGLSPYLRVGNLPLLLWVILALGVAWWRRRRSELPQPTPV